MLPQGAGVVPRLLITNDAEPVNELKRRLRRSSADASFYGRRPARLRVGKTGPAHGRAGPSSQFRSGGGSRRYREFAGVEADAVERGGGFAGGAGEGAGEVLQLTEPAILGHLGEAERRVQQEAAGRLHPDAGDLVVRRAPEPGDEVPLE